MQDARHAPPTGEPERPDVRVCLEGKNHVQISSVLQTVVVMEVCLSSFISQIKRSLHGSYGGNMGKAVGTGIGSTQAAETPPQRGRQPE